jgi:hypothetical protein
MAENNILWLIRCTKYEYAKQFIDEGVIMFNTPFNWIEMEKNEGKGRGDILEGIYASSPIHDFNKKIILQKLRKNVISEQYKGNTVFRASTILDIPCFSLFVLSDTSFSNNFFTETNKYAITTKLIKKYFNDFSNHTTRAEIDSLEQDDRPVVLIIQSPKKFLDRINESLIKIGFQKEDVLIDFVQYTNKNQFFLSTLPYPQELFFKDSSFKHQSELRIIINSKNKHAIDKFKKNGRFVKLGSTSDFAIIHDYYLDDMLIEKRGNSLFYNLPIPVITEIDMSSKEEVQRVIHFLINDEYHNIDEIREAQKQVKDLINHYYKEFNEHIQVPIDFWIKEQ